MLVEVGHEPFLVTQPVEECGPRIMEARREGKTENTAWLNLRVRHPSLIGPACTTRILFPAPGKYLQIGSPKLVLLSALWAADYCRLRGLQELNRLLDGFIGYQVMKPATRTREPARW